MAEAPDIRIGTAEREEALARLRDHFSAGRLSVAEFDERCGRVAAATTRSELDPLFADLPSETTDEPKPERPQARWDWIGAAMALTPIIAIILFFTLGSWLWFLLIPAVPAVLEGGRRVIGN